MSEYVITPSDTPSWALDVERIVPAISDRWPGSDAKLGPPFSGHLSSASGRVETRPQRLSFYIDDKRTMLAVSPVADNEMAELTEWFLSYIPKFDTEIRLYCEDFNRYLVLEPSMTKSDILRFLESSSDS